MQSIEPLDGKEHTTRLVRQVQSNVLTVYVFALLMYINCRVNLVLDNLIEEVSVPSGMHGIFGTCSQQFLSLKIQCVIPHIFAAELASVTAKL